MDDTYIKATLISTYTFAALSQQVTVAPYTALYAYYSPLHTALMNAYSQWKVQAGAQQGKTTSLKNLLAELSSIKIEDWDLDIQNVYRKGSPEYVALLPEGRGPFQSGKQGDRILAVRALRDALANDADLQTLHTEVEAFYALLDGTNTSQKGAISATDQRSEDVEKAVVECAEGLFYVYGGLVQKFYKTPDDIENFFAVDLIREKEQSAFSGTVPAGGRKAIAKRTLAPTAQIRIVNSGPTRLKFFLVDDKNADPGVAGVKLNPGEDLTFPASALGSGPYLTVINEDVQGAGSFELALL